PPLLSFPTRRSSDLHVRLAQRPAVGKFRSRRQIFRIAFDRALFGPLRDGADLLHTQAPRVEKITIPRLGLPRRHVARMRHASDLDRKSTRLNSSHDQ